jgi:CDP-diacylglycerol--glycerol-3-phosphate 3-phosphatidyltransferase
VFYVVYQVPDWFGCCHVLSVGILWGLMVLIEVSDVVDGHIARSMNLVTDVGKVLDPFADVISRLTYFFCFVQAGFMPGWLLLIIMYREYGIILLRLLGIRRGVAIGARAGGKLKAVLYALSSVLGLVALTISRTGVWKDALPAVSGVAYGVFVLAAFFALLSFVDYAVVFRRLDK